MGTRVEIPFVPDVTVIGTTPPPSPEPSTTDVTTNFPSRSNIDSQTVSAKTKSQTNSKQTI